MVACLVCATSLAAQSVKVADTSSSRSSPNSTSASPASVVELQSFLTQNSTPAGELQGPAADVFEQLVHHAPGGSGDPGFRWELRITKGLAENAFSLPNGAVYVDQEMARTLGNNPGLWAAVLAHEIAHVTERHWAQRADFEKSLRDPQRNWGLLHLGVFPAGLDASTSAERETELADFSRELELAADSASLGLMARSGFHPDFVIALYHLMEAQEGIASAQHFLASHPGWDVREAKLHKKYLAAVAEYEKLWPRPYESPGGNAPALAFMGRPQVQPSRANGTTEIRLPLHCEHMPDPVEVVVLLRRLSTSTILPDDPPDKLEQTTACTSERTMVSFDLGPGLARGNVAAEFYVMDHRGWILGRSSKLRFRDGN